MQDVIAPVHHEFAHAVPVIFQELLMCLHAFWKKLSFAHLSLTVFIFLYFVHHHKCAVNRQADKNLFHSKFFLQAEFLAREGLPSWGIGVVGEEAKVHRVANSEAIIDDAHNRSEETTR